MCLLVKRAPAMPATSEHTEKTKKQKPVRFDRTGLVWVSFLAACSEVSQSYAIFLSSPFYGAAYK